MKNIFLICLSIITFITYGVNDCKVKLSELNQKYEGECKRGLAHGIGKAWGESDFYEGEFKKGLPHGKDTYTWGNGNVCIGDFKKGMMDGEGNLTFKDASGEITVKKGFFDNGEFLGEHKNPYKIVSQSGILIINLIENRQQVNEVRISIFNNGNEIFPQLDIRDLNNTNIEMRNGVVLTNVKYPLKQLEVRFTVDSFSYNAILDIYKEGNWQINLAL